MTTGRTSLAWLLLLGTGIGVFTGLWLIPHLNRLNDQTHQLNQLEQERSRLAARVVELTEELRTKPPEAETDSESSDEDVSVAKAQTRAEQTKRVEEIRLLGETQKRLTDATLTVHDLEAKIADLTASMQRLEADNKRVAQNETELSAQLERANRVISAMQEQISGNEDRVVSSEVRNRKLDEQRRAAEQALTETREVVQNLEDLYRRREDLLTRIVGRYREAADQYRNISLRLSHTGQTDPQSLDLSQIENVLTLADEDLRQFEKLTVRAAQLRDELEGQR